MNVKTRFEQRRSELSQLVATVAELEARATLGSSDRILNLSTAEVMRASAFVFAYNVVEATIRDCLEVVWNDIVSNSAKFHEARHFWRHHFLWTRLSKTLQAERGMAPILESIDRLFWDRSGLTKLNMGSNEMGFVPEGGNVGYEKLEELAKNIGLHVRLSKEIIAAKDLDIIKRRRNELAHGLKTFNEVGKDYTGNILREIIDRGMLHVERFVAAAGRFHEGERWRVSHRHSQRS